MSNNNTDNDSNNTLGNHENQIHQNQDDVVPSPPDSPRQSREGTPVTESRADQQEQSEHFE